jgi:hypothetical protein
LVVSAASFATFLICGWHLAHAGVLPGDALSRTLSAASAVSGRDPHLEAIGFVWPPFPTLFESGVLGAVHVRELVSIGLAGVVVSAALMAGAVGALRTWFEDCGLGRVARLGLVAAFALSPMILLYGSNGMSEAGMICFLALAAVRLARWYRSDATGDLVVTSIWLGMAYLTRYEVVGSIIVVIALVALVTYHREAGPRRERRRVATTAAVVVGLPAVFAAFLWALLSWAVIGQPFAQFTSEYGNSAIVRSATEKAGGGSLADGGARMLLLGKQVLVFGGLAIVSALVLLWWGRRGWHRVAAAVAVLLPPVLFQAGAAATGTTFGFARFSISLVPLGFMLLGVAISGVDHRHALRSSAVALLAIGLAAASAIPAFVVMRRGTLGTIQDAAALSTLPSPYRASLRHRGGIPIHDGRTVARAVERLSPRPGSVVVDTAWAFPIVLEATDRRTFITPPDRDFMQVLADPYTFGVRYMLVSHPSTLAHDEIRATFPGIYDNGAGIGKLVEEWNFDSMHLRLYKVTKAVSR